MAGDWIKMRKDLAEDPAVISVAFTCNIGEDLVVGKLHRLWSWADSHTSDGNALSVTFSWVDRYIGVTGFAQALHDAGWLDGDEHHISFPKFDRHNGKSAKRRVLTANRVRNARSVTKALPEKRREEKRDTTNVVSISQCETLYQLYPKRIGKGAALKAIRAALGKVEFNTLREAVESYAQARKGEDQQFTPNPATWFNQERWNDDRRTWINSPGSRATAAVGREQERIDRNVDALKQFAAGSNETRLFARDGGVNRAQALGGPDTGPA